MSRLVKQIIIGSVLFLLLIGLGIGAYAIFRTGPTCDDGIQNGKEEGVDCGTLACGSACEDIAPLQVISAQLIKVGEGDYDFIGTIYNPNGAYGSGNFKYRINLIAEDGTFVTMMENNAYILPGQTRYVAQTAIKNTTPLSDARLTIVEAEWQKLEFFRNAVTFRLKNKQYRHIQSSLNITPEPDLIPNEATAEGISYSEFDGILTNDSDFDFQTVDVIVVLFDEFDSIVGVNTTTINRFNSRTDRYFKVSWPFEIAGNVDRQDVEASTNVFLNSNFINSHGGSQEKFQRFY